MFLSKVKWAAIAFLGACIAQAAFRAAEESSGSHSPSWGKHTQSLRTLHEYFCVTRPICRQFNSCQSFSINEQSGGPKAWAMLTCGGQVQRLRKELIAWTRPSVLVSLGDAIIWALLWAGLSVNVKRADTNVCAFLSLRPPAACPTGLLQWPRAGYLGKDGTRCRAMFRGEDGVFSTLLLGLCSSFGSFMADLHYSLTPHPAPSFPQFCWE